MVQQRGVGERRWEACLKRHCPASEWGANKKTPRPECVLDRRKPRPSILLPSFARSAKNGVTVPSEPICCVSVTVAVTSPLKVRGPSEGRDVQSQHPLKPRLGEHAWRTRRRRAWYSILIRHSSRATSDETILATGVTATPGGPFQISPAGPAPIRTGVHVCMYVIKYK